METTKRCIFHIPNHIDAFGTSGSNVRPLKMLAAFRNIGYEVDIVMGYGAERAKQIKTIKQRIRDGVHYDFMYSESSTMPTLFTEKHHLPTYPTLDFGFFRFCKSHGIKIGLFYRDIYWKFPIYSETVKGLKRISAIAAYKYDLKQYERYLDVLYLPSQPVAEYIDSPYLKSVATALPPGATYDKAIIEERSNFFNNMHDNPPQTLRLFYVGGLGGVYNFVEVLNAVHDLDYVDITICCRAQDWKLYNEAYSEYVTPRIHIVHESGKELEKHYNIATICFSCYTRSKYTDMAAHVKLYEYLSHVTPILVSDGTEESRNITKTGAGWSVQYDAQSIRELLEHLYHTPNDIISEHENCLKVLDDNTWEARARTVAAQLTNS